MYEKLGRFIVAHRLVVLGFILAMTVTGAVLLPGIRFDFTPQALFEQQNEVNEFAADVRATFGDDTNTLMILWRTGEEDGVFQPETLEDIRTVTEDLADWEHAQRVTSITNMRLPRNEQKPKRPWQPRDGATRSNIEFGPDQNASIAGQMSADIIGRTAQVSGRVVGSHGYESVLDLGPLLPAGDVTPEAAANVRQHVAGEKLLDKVVVSRDFSRTAVLIELGEEARDINTLFDIVETLEGKLDTWEAELPSDPEFSLSGLPAVRVGIIGSLQQEQMFFLPLTAVIMFFLLAIVFRSVSGVLLPMGSIGLAIIWTGALLVVFDEPINIISNVMPILITVIGLSDGIHLLSRASEEASTHEDRDEVVIQTVRRMGVACLLTSVTTAIGFGSLLMARTDILQNFGIFTAAGVMMAYLATILFIPVMLTWMPAPGRSGVHAKADKHGLIEKLMLRSSDVVMARPLTWMVAGFLLAGLAGWSILTWGKIDARLLEVFPPEHPTANLVREVENEFSGVLGLVVSINAEEEGYFLQPENLEKLAELQRTIEEVDLETSERRDEPVMVLNTSSVHDLLQVFRSAYLDKPQLRDTPFDSKAQIQTVLRLYRNDAASDVNRLLTPDNSHAIITVRLRDMGLERGQLNVQVIADKAEELFGEGAAEGVVGATTPTKNRPVQVRLSGDVYLASVGLQNFIYDLLYSLGLASIIIFFAMMILFRSVRIGLMSVIPNAFPLILTAGWMSFRGIELNTSTVVIFSISLGLAVDDTIHFLTRYKEERLDGYQVEVAIRRTFLGAGRAIIMTSIVLSCGLAVLLTTEFMPTRQFAELTFATVIGAILGDLFILPGLLLIFDKRDADEVKALPGLG